MSVAILKFNQCLMGSQCRLERRDACVSVWPVCVCVSTTMMAGSPTQSTTSRCWHHSMMYWALMSHVVALLSRRFGYNTAILTASDWRLDNCHWWMTVRSAVMSDTGHGRPLELSLWHIRRDIDGLISCLAKVTCTTCASYLRNCHMTHL